MIAQGWTDERVETLKRLWSDGLSASQVASRLGGVSRSAVIGKLYRLGLTRGKAAASHPRSARRPVRAPPAVSLAPRRRPLTSSTLDRKIPADRRGLVADCAGLQRHHCRWPIGEPGSADFGFCGLRRTGVGPYCPAHHQIARAPCRASAGQEGMGS
jgi:GcrA cell cycle regulator